MTRTEIDLRAYWLGLSDVHRMKALFIRFGGRAALSAIARLQSGTVWESMGLFQDVYLPYLMQGSKRILPVQMRSAVERVSESKGAV